MEAWVWIVIAVVAVAVIIVVALAVLQRRRRSRLQGRFGPEYDRALEGERRGPAERQLKERIRRRDELEIRPLSAAARERYTTQWHELQARFVDQPEQAVGEADVLVSEVMRERGYPVDDFEAQAELISVDHPRVVENYRTAHGTYDRQGERRASTEDLREAVVAYRSLFDELLSDSEEEERVDR